MSSKQQKIGLKILELRRRKGLKQSELAKELNVTQRKISDIERGVLKKIDINFIELIAEYFKLPVEHFLGIKKGEFFDEEKTGLYLIKTLDKDKERKQKLIGEYLLLDQSNDTRRMKNILKELYKMLDKYENEENEEN